MSNNYVRKILYVLNTPIRQKIKDGYTKGWQYKDLYKKIACGWEFGFTIPLGYSIADAEKHRGNLIAACGKYIELIGYKGLLVVQIHEKPMPTMIKFEAKMLEGLRPSEILIGFDSVGNRITFNWEHPHGIFAGETGMGKTDCIRLFTYCLLHDPEEIDIRIIDLKVLSFLPFKGIPNITIGTSINDAYKMLSEVAKEVKRRNVWVESMGSREVLKGSKLQKIVVIIDEAADLSPYKFKGDMKKFAQQIEQYIATITQMGREVKIHLIYCTQYPTVQVVSAQIKINAGLRICFYVPTQKNSEVVLEKGGAELLHGIPGRAILKKNLYTTIQVPYVGGDPVWKEKLTPFRTVVIHDGNSTRTDKERNYIDGSYESASSNNGTNSQITYKLQPPKESESTSTGITTGEASGVGVASKKQTMAANKKRVVDAEWYSDEL